MWFELQSLQVMLQVRCSSPADQCGSAVKGVKLLPRQYEWQGEGRLGDALELIHLCLGVKTGCHSSQCSVGPAC